MVRPARLLLSLLLLCAPPALAEEEAASSAEGTESSAARGGGWEGGLSAARPEDHVLVPVHSLWVPLLEVPAFHLLLYGFNRATSGEQEWTKVSGASIRRNLGGGWWLDSDDVFVNYLGHPYHGALNFNSARSSGTSFWGALPFAFGSSLAWEVAGEGEPPSINDFLITATSGAVLGEALHRVAVLLLEGPGRPTALGQLSAFVVDPFGGFNRRLLGQRVSRASLPAPAPHEGGVRLGARWLAGVRSSAPAPLRLPSAPLQGALALDLVYGHPAPGRAAPVKPLDHFRLEAGVGLPGPVTADLLVRGLLVGQPFGGGGLAGAWGLWGSHDFLTLPEARVSSGALGVGGVLEHALGAGRRLRATGVLSGIVLGGAGALHQTDELRRDKALGPGYGVGPGAQALLDVEVLWGREAALRLTGRSWRIHPLAGGRPWEEVEALGVGGRLRVGGPHMLGVGLDVGRRAAGPQARQAGVTAHLFWWVPLGQAR